MTGAVTLLSLQEDKGLRYRSGFRRADIKTPTVYQLQYTWKTPEFESPLLSAERILHHSSHPTQTQTERQQGATDDPVEEQQGDPLRENPHEREPAEEHAEPMGGESEHGSEILKNGSGHVSSHRRKLDSEPKKEPPKTLSTSGLPKGRKRSHRHKKPRHHRKHFVSEYQAQFKCWPVTKKESEGEGGKRARESVAGLMVPSKHQTISGECVRLDRVPDIMSTHSLCTEPVFDMGT